MTRARMHAAAALVLGLLSLGLVPFGHGTGPQARADGQVELAATAQREGPLRLRVQEMTPRVAEAGTGRLEITATVSNSGDQPIRELEVRLQRGVAVASQEALSGAARGENPATARSTRFEPVTGELPAGESADVRLSIPLGAEQPNSLAIAEPGVYPLLLNLNGEPAGGARSRLAELHTLLPVRASAPQPPETAHGLTVLWPITARPRLLPVPYDSPPVLTDGGLSPALAPGGRLDGLLDALERSAPAGSALASSLCVALDPDLLRTVQAMTGDYRVRDANSSLPSSPQTPPQQALNAPAQTHQGAGSQAASAWLARLRAVLQDRCVIALPYADPDVVALTRTGNRQQGSADGAARTAAFQQLLSTARQQGSAVVSDIARVAPKEQLAWPPGGLLDEPTLRGMQQAGRRTVVLRPEGLRRSGRESPDRESPDRENPGPGATPDSRQGAVPLGQAVRVPVPGSEEAPDAQVTAVPADPLVAGALGAAAPAARGESGDRAGPPDSGDERDGTRPTAGNTDSVLATQDGLAALVYRVQQSAREPAAAGSTIVMTPPRHWQAGATATAALLETAATLLQQGSLTARPLTELGATDAEQGTTGTAALRYTPESSLAELPEELLQRASIQRVIGRLRKTAIMDTTRSVPPEVAFRPATLALLRACSARWRDRELGGLDAAEHLMTVAQSNVHRLQNAVAIQGPPGPITMASSDSPVPLTVSNSLPVRMRVRVQVRQAQGLRTEPIGVIDIPAGSSRQLRVEADVERSGQFTVRTQLSTVEGTPLGQTTTITVRSTQFGFTAVAITVIGGALLVLLSGWRITQRVRAARTHRRSRTR